MALFVGFAKLVFVAVLAFIFLYFFGYPAFDRYLEKSVLIKVSTTSPPKGKKGLLPPAITLCPKTPSKPYATGWKNSSGDYHQAINSECDNPRVREDVINCIEEKTYKLSEILSVAFDGMKNPRNLLNMSYWTSDLTYTSDGKCYTLEYQKLFSADFEQDSIWLFLNPDLVLES